MKNIENLKNVENIEQEIEKLLGELYGFAEKYENLETELQSEWYDVEMEAEVGKDREKAKVNLQEFIVKLKGVLEKE